MLPPAHRFHHTPVFVSFLDLAINKRKIQEDERLIQAHAAIRAGDVDPDLENPLADCPWQSVDEHPVHRYTSGESRWDLATIQPWLLEGVEPTRFVLRRLDYDEYRIVKQLRFDGQYIAAFYECARLGLVKVDGLPGLPKWPDRDRDHPAPLTEHQLGKLRSLVGDKILEQVGAAVFVVSTETTDSEGKH